MNNDEPIIRIEGLSKRFGDVPALRNVSLGIPQGRIVGLVGANGGGKSEELLRRCIEAGVRITVEDLDEPARIDRIAGELGTTARVRLRVKPDFPNLWKATDFAQEKASIDLAIQTYKAGIPAQYLPELGRESGGAPGNFALLDQLAALAWVRKEQARGKVIAWGSSYSA